MAEFKNPNQPGGNGNGGQDSRSLLVMMVVMFGVIFGLQIWRAKHNPQTAAPSSPAGDHAAASRTRQAAAAAPLGSAPTAAGKPGRGARRNRCTGLCRSHHHRRERPLPHHLLQPRRPGHLLGPQALPRQRQASPSILVHAGAAKQFGYPLSLYTYDAALTQSLAQALYVPSASGDRHRPGGPQLPLRLRQHRRYQNLHVRSAHLHHPRRHRTVLRDGAPIRALALLALRLRRRRNRASLRRRADRHHAERQGRPHRLQEGLQRQHAQRPL